MYQQSKKKWLNALSYADFLKFNLYKLFIIFNHTISF